ncbi:MAG TPA: dienelactone hydrolase family protein [Actinocrinis sp.]|nr:dienelactone hydrolase family protein [Actinocrinis sp.]
MTEILLFHSALGLRPGVHAFADRLRGDGHTVHVPDFYDGRTFDDLTEGIAYRDQLGFDEIGRRATAHAQPLPADLVYLGFSLGAGPAQLLAQTRPGARGAILMHGALPSATFGAPWPAPVPLAVHTSVDDPWVDDEAARSLAAEAAVGDLHRYPGAGHLFTDPDLPDYDEAATTLAVGRIREFLARV